MHPLRADGAFSGELHFLCPGSPASVYPGPSPVSQRKGGRRGIKLKLFHRSVHQDSQKRLAQGMPCVLWKLINSVFSLGSLWFPGKQMCRRRWKCKRFIGDNTCEEKRSTFRAACTGHGVRHRSGTCERRAEKGGVGQRSLGQRCCSKEVRPTPHSSRSKRSPMLDRMARPWLPAVPGHWPRLSWKSVASAETLRLRGCCSWWLSVTAAPRELSGGHLPMAAACFSLFI